MTFSLVYRAFLILPFVLILAGRPVLSQPAAMGWPDAVAQLANQRTHAEACVSLLKRFGDKQQVANGQLDYANAKANADAVIAGLITALSAGQEPASLSSLQTTLSTGNAALAEFCNRVTKLVPATPAGQK